MKQSLPRNGGPHPRRFLKLTCGSATLKRSATKWCRNWMAKLSPRVARFPYWKVTPSYPSTRQPAVPKECSMSCSQKLVSWVWVQGQRFATERSRNRRVKRNKLKKKKVPVRILWYKSTIPPTGWPDLYLGGKISSSWPLTFSLFPFYIILPSSPFYQRMTFPSFPYFSSDTDVTLWHD